MRFGENEEGERLKEIVVMSGKGGTGKTSITAALGVLAGGEAVVADCDVGAANLHILYEPKTLTSASFWSGKTAVINQETCVCCGICQESCRFGAIGYQNDEYVVDDVSCEGCSVCHHLCPVDAVTMRENRAGDWFVALSRFGGWFVHARLGIAQDNSGKLVAKVKGETRKLATREDVPYVIVDGPPGVGCPAISAVSGASRVVIVTEASQSGLHDLRRMANLARAFKIEVSCVINKCDLNNKVRRDIEVFCDTCAIDVLAAIPFTTVFSNALQERKTLVEMDDAQTKDHIEQIWDRLQ